MEIVFLMCANTTNKGGLDGGYFGRRDWKVVCRKIVRHVHASCSAGKWRRVTKRSCCFSSMTSSAVRSSLSVVSTMLNE